MLIHKIHDNSNSYIISLLENSLSGISDEHLMDNYSPSRKNINSNLFYILENGRYSSGAYYVVEDAAELICSAGWNMYNEDTALILTRAYVSPKCRASYPMAEFLLPLILEEVSGFKNVWITCNKYNKPIYDWFSRNANNLRPALFNNWPEIYSQFEPIGMHTIYNTEQYVVQLKR